jgi:hypothetical protein
VDSLEGSKPNEGSTLMHLLKVQPKLQEEIDMLQQQVKMLTDKGAIGIIGKQTQR